MDKHARKQTLIEGHKFGTRQGLYLCRAIRRQQRRRRVVVTNVDNAKRARARKLVPER